MKVGDKVPVTIAGQAVTQAEVREMGDGQAVLIVPATRVVMAVRTELAYEAPAPVEPEKETIITGVEQREVAPVVDSVDSANAETHPQLGTDVTTNVDGTTVVDTTTGETTAQGNDPVADAAVNNQLPEQVAAVEEKQ